MAAPTPAQKSPTPTTTPAPAASSTPSLPALTPSMITELTNALNVLAKAMIASGIVTRYTSKTPASLKRDVNEYLDALKD